MNGCRSIIAFGPVRIPKKSSEFAADLLQRRATVAAVASGASHLDEFRPVVLVHAAVASRRTKPTAIPPPQPCSHAVSRDVTAQRDDPHRTAAAMRMRTPHARSAAGPKPHQLIGALPNRGAEAPLRGAAAQRDKIRWNEFLNRRMRARRARSRTDRVAGIAAVCPNHHEAR
jgi:hypothetical protein